MIRKIGLGTVQFGMNYGINNKIGKVPNIQIYDILNIAIQKGINIIDTAEAYGESEKILGEYLNIKKFKIISKFQNIRNIDNSIKNSLEKLNVKKIYGYLAHSFDNIKENFGLIKNLYKLKDLSLVEKIGFSLYYPAELDFLLDKNIDFDLIQIPYNVFDRRFEKYFPILKKKNIEIHIRSVYLQGLFFLKRIPQFFKVVEKKIIFLQQISKKYNIPLNKFLLYFCLSNKLIDKVIIGIDNKKQFLENILFSVEDFSKLNYIFVNIDIDELKVDDKRIIIPSNWDL